MAALGSSPVISFLMVVRDTSAQLLDASIGSVSAQLYARWELIVVDDASATALMLAAFGGSLPAVKILVEAEAEVNQPGWTALHYGAASGNTEPSGWSICRSAGSSTIVPRCASADMNAGNTSTFCRKRRYS